MKQSRWLKRLPPTALFALHVIILLAGFVGPYDPTMQNRNSALAPPMAVHFFDARGVFHARPRVFSSGSETAYPLRFLVSGSAYRLFGLWTARTHLFGVDAPGRIFALGTDEFGRDQLSRILWGGQISLLTGWLAAVLSLGTGLILGSVAGVFGGWQDSVIMRGVELFLALPWLYLLLAVRAFLPLSMSPHTTALVLAAVIGVIGWARPARLVRGIVLSTREREYVQAARGFGASSWYVLRRHCLKETYSVLATQGALLVPQYILAETTLSFVGLGIGEPAASWGNLLTPLKQVSILTSSWWMIVPALLLMLTTWCFLSVGDVLAGGDR